MIKYHATFYYENVDYHLQMGIMTQKQALKPIRSCNDAINKTSSIFLARRASQLIRKSITTNEIQVELS